MILELCEVYSSAIAAIAKANGLSTAMRKAMPVELENGVMYAGGFFLTRPGSTKPEMVVAFSFWEDRVILQTIARNQLNERTAGRQTWTYLEGIDSWLVDLDKDLKAGKLDHKQPHGRAPGY